MFCNWGCIAYCGEGTNGKDSIKLQIVLVAQTIAFQAKAAQIKWRDSLKDGRVAQSLVTEVKRPEVQ